MKTASHLLEAVLGVHTSAGGSAAAKRERIGQLLSGQNKNCHCANLIYHSRPWNAGPFVRAAARILFHPRAPS